MYRTFGSGGAFVLSTELIGIAISTWCVAALNEPAKEPGVWKVSRKGKSHAPSLRPSDFFQRPQKSVQQINGYSVVQVRQ
jgi:hypothetical protein